MNNLDLKVFALGELYANCYVVYDKSTKDAFIVDAPSPVSSVIDFAQEQKLKILFIALTHGHFDHISGLNETKLPYYMHQKDLVLLKNPNVNGSCFFESSVMIERKPEGLLEEGTPFAFGDLSAQIIHTPGHTPGSVSIKINNWLFSGDTLFLGSIGRTDIPLASHKSLMSSIKEKLFVLPKDTIVYPGHGGSTTIGEEIISNPFLK